MSYPARELLSMDRLPCSLRHAAEKTSRRRSAGGMLCVYTTPKPVAEASVCSNTGATARSSSARINGRSASARCSSRRTEGHKRAVRAPSLRTNAYTDEKVARLKRWSKNRFVNLPRTRSTSRGRAKPHRSKFAAKRLISKRAEIRKLHTNLVNPSIPKMEVLDACF